MEPSRVLAGSSPDSAQLLAAVFIPTGWGKLHDLEKVTGFFTERAIPAPHFHAVLVAVTEFGRGTLLLIGLGSRLAAIPWSLV